jgi:predicted DNA binding CopG/RHH family protein
MRDRYFTGKEGMMPPRSDRKKVPKFATEAEEARWWDDNRKLVEENLIQPIEDGTVQKGTALRLARETRPSRNITIRMAEADLDLAREQAERKGLPYQTYIKSVLHEALTKRRAATEAAPGWLERRCYALSIIYT